MLVPARPSRAGNGTERGAAGTNRGPPVTKPSPAVLDSGAMDSSASTWLARYQPWRRQAEIGFWVVVLLAEATFNTATSWIDLRRTQPDFPLGLAAALELTSVLAIGLLIPAVIRFEQRFPLGRTTLRRHLPFHLAGTVVFSLAHVALMLAFRALVLPWMGHPFRPGPWTQVLGYEYLKDVRTYVLVLVALWSYRMLLMRLQGEARVLDPPEPAPGEPAAPPAPSRPERFLVRKLRKEFLIAAAEIDWVQAQGNYVALRVNGHEYLLRSTLAEFLEQLDPARFVRVHRSFAVNRDRIAEIEPQDDGDARLRMKDGSEVPCSRRYREALVG